MLHKESMKEHIASVVVIEKRADVCVEHLSLAATTCHIAVWTVLSATVAMIEDQYARVGPDSAEFRAAMINLGRFCPMVIRWLKVKSECHAPSDWVAAWEPSLGALATSDLTTVQNYDAFQCSYPMWYRDRAHAEILDGNAVRFTVDGTGRDRQVSAYHKGLRPSQGMFKAIPGHRIEPSVGILRRYQRILAEASVTDRYGFSYEHSYELARRTHKKYTQRLDAIVRRSDRTDLGGYTLGIFKKFYAALQAVCAIHEYLCFCWMKWEHPYPLSSAVLVKNREAWGKLIADLARIDLPTTNRIIGDLTFYSKRLPDLHVYPFVPLEESHITLALIPHFVLNSNPEDNILRICSYLRQSSYDLLSNDKETTMRETLMGELKRFSVHHSINLPDGSTEIDLLVEDEASSTVLIAEMKWYRKPSTYRERLRADEQFLDGVHRQLRTIKQFCRERPEFLKERKKLKRNLSEYEHVYYMLIARDHWIWVEPDDQTSVVDFEQFRSALSRHQSLDSVLSDLLAFEWLPVEGRDFHVRYDSRSVEDVSVESEVFFGGPPR
jgi:hypothetical protein